MVAVALHSQTCGRQRFFTGSQSGYFSHISNSQNKIMKLLIQFNVSLHFNLLYIIY